MVAALAIGWSVRVRYPADAMSDPESPSSREVHAAKPDDPANAIDRDVPCVQCGYNLRGLQSASVCPECALSISSSLRVGLVALPRSDLEVWRLAARWCLWVPLLVGVTSVLALLGDLVGMAGYFLASFFVATLFYVASFVFFVEHLQKCLRVSPATLQPDRWFPILGGLMFVTAIPGATGRSDVIFAQIVFLFLILGPCISSWRLTRLSNVIRDRVLAIRARSTLGCVLLLALLLNIGLYAAGKKSFGVFPDRLFAGPSARWFALSIGLAIGLFLIGCLHARLMYRLSFLIRHELRVREGL